MSPSTGPAEVDGGWPAAWSLALADTALVEAGSNTIFERGAAYVRAGAVEIVDEDPMPEPAVRARVTGSATYDVEVWIEADAVAGDCSCPHAADGWFCKHQVAVAMVWRQRLAGTPTPSPDAAGVRPARTAFERRQALHAFLHGQEAASLADKLLELAQRDRHVERDLQQWRKLSRMDGDWAGIRRVVAEMLLPRRDFIAWDGGGDYVSRASTVLPVLERAIARDPCAAVPLCLHALRGTWAVLEQADDSDGAIGDFAATIGEKFVAALQAAPDQPKRFADVYLDLRLDEPFSAFDPRAAEAAMGEAALAGFRQTLRSRWQAAHAARGGRRAPVASSASRRTPVAPDVSLRATILCSESRWLEAWAIVQPPNLCAAAQLKHIARNLPPTHHPEAVRVLKQLFEREILGATSPYREALALVGDIGRRLPLAERSAWLLGLRVEFKAKRNFIRDLPDF